MKQKNNVPSAIAVKWKSLWGDGRPFSVRLITALFVAAAFSFTFFVFGPYELYIQSKQYLTFRFSVLVFPIAIAGLIILAVLTGILLLLRGKLHNYAVTALCAVTLSGWIQGNFLNIDHGSLDGTDVVWTNFAMPMLWNILIWIGIAVLLFALMYFSRKLWTGVVRIVSLALIGAQIIALCTLLPKTDFTVAGEENYISTRDIYSLSEQKNVVFFLLDRLDTKYFYRALDAQPDIRDHFSGFTCYRNFTGSYTRTMPAVCYLLTGVKEDYSMPWNEYFQKAWSESTFLRDIRAEGYGTRVYSELMYVFGGDANNVAGVIDNIDTAKTRTDVRLMLSSMYKLSAYRYLPEAFKPYFRIYTGDLAAIATVGDGDVPAHTTNDYLFWKNFREQGLTIDSDSKGEFVFYHMLGAHEPFVMNEDAEPFAKDDNRNGTGKQLAQIRGNLTQMFRYFEQMKEAGVYDNTTIIVSADHGETGTLKELDHQRMLTLLIKPAGADSTVPMQASDKQICQDNLRASIASYFGVEDPDGSKYGRTIESIGEDEEMTRYFWMQSCGDDPHHRDVQTVTYEIHGDANDFSNWKIVSIDPILYPYYDTEQTKGL